VSVVVAIDDDDDDDNNNTDDGLELNHCLNFYHDNHSTRNTTSPRILLQQMPLESTTGTIIFPWIRFPFFFFLLRIESSWWRRRCYGPSIVCTRIRSNTGVETMSIFMHGKQISNRSLN
jgi:hypothetical protein